MLLTSRSFGIHLDMSARRGLLLFGFIPIIFVLPMETRNDLWTIPSPPMDTIVITKKVAVADMAVSFQQVIKADPTNALAHYNYANFLYYVVRDTLEAKKELTIATGLSPEFSLAHFALGVIWHEQGYLIEAEREFETAIATDSSYYYSYIALGMVWQDMDFTLGAELICRDAIELAPESLLAYNNLAILLQDQGRLEEAEAIYREALQKYPDNPFILNNLASVLDDYEEAEFYIRRALELAPENIEIHRSLASLLNEKGDWEEAKREYLYVLERDTINSRLYNEFAVMLKKMGEEKLAEEMYRKAIALDPYFYTARHNLGVLLLGENRLLEEAEVQFRKAVEINPEYSLGYSSLASYLYIQGDTIGAREMLRKAVEVDSNNTNAFYVLGTILLEQDSIEVAEEIIRHALEIDSANVRLHEAFGVIRGRQGYFDEAGQCIGFAFHNMSQLDSLSQRSITENYVWTLLERAREYLLRDFDKSILKVDSSFTLLEEHQMFSEKTKNVFSGQAYLLRGTIHLMKRSAKEAIEDFTTAKNLNPKDTLSLYNNLAYAYLSLGEWDKAEITGLILMDYLSQPPDPEEWELFKKIEKGREESPKGFSIRWWQLPLLVIGLGLSVWAYFWSLRKSKVLRNQLILTGLLILLLLGATVFFLPYVESISFPGVGKVDVSLKEILLPKGMPTSLVDIQIPRGLTEPIEPEIPPVEFSDTTAVRRTPHISTSRGFQSP